MPIVKLSNGVLFEARTSDTLLDAAHLAGITLPYSCKMGRCSTCKCKVKQGQTIALQKETGLTEIEKDNGWILSCVRAAQNDVTLEVEDFGDLILPPSKTLPCRISSLELLTPDVIIVKLRLPPSASFKAIPGQYIDVIGPLGVRRSYSLANASTKNNTLELHVRAVEGGVMSNYWFNLAKDNDLLRLNGPLGTFFLRNLAQVNLVFLATGTGIAPVKAMLESLTSVDTSKAPKSVTVYWGCRTPSDLYIDLHSILGGHQFVPVLSRSAADWDGATGYVQDALLSTHPDLSSTVVYACGSDAMIQAAKTKLFAAGLPETRFFADAFVSSAPQ